MDAEVSQENGGEAWRRCARWLGWKSLSVGGALGGLGETAGAGFFQGIPFYPSQRKPRLPVDFPSARLRIRENCGVPWQDCGELAGAASF